MTSIIDGRSLARDLQKRIAVGSRYLQTQIGRQPSLAMVLVGNNPASRIYVANKARSAAACEVTSVIVNLKATSSPEKTTQQLDELAQNPAIDGMILQLPLPHHQNPAQYLEKIPPEKDIDGLTLKNTGSLWSGKSTRLTPCTPSGVMHLIRSAPGIRLKDDGAPNLAGLSALVIGRSRLVGRPLATLLLQADATVTIAHRGTDPEMLRHYAAGADILVAAAGSPGLVTGDMVKPGAVVIDVGITRLDSGKIVGDVDFNAAAKKARAITPVPGGVGPMTITYLLGNCLIAAASRAGLDDFTW